MKRTTATMDYNGVLTLWEGALGLHNDHGTWRVRDSSDPRQAQPIYILDRSEWRRLTLFREIGEMLSPGDRATFMADGEADLTPMRQRREREYGIVAGVARIDRPAFRLVRETTDAEGRIL